MLSACQMALPFRQTATTDAAPPTDGAITVTSLDAPPVAPPEQAPAPPADSPAAEPAAEPPVSPPPPKSAAQIACEKGRGSWVKAGNTGTMTCQTQLRDSGKQCSRDGDCMGQCLARSRTCAPFAPLFGCHEVLQDNGQRVTLCID